MDQGVVAALQPDRPDLGADSDHKIVYIGAVLEGCPANPWTTHTYRPYHQEGEEKFRQWVLLQTWESVLSAGTTNAKADEYQDLVLAALNRCFPEKTVKRREKDPPWVNDTTKKLDGHPRNFSEGLEERMNGKL
jgi:hypothetical protein